MKTFQQIGADHGELVQKKNAAYGSSFAKCGEYLRLLYPDGMRPENYEDALLLARDFDKSMRIANHREAFGENPYSDKIGYAILGYHLHQRNEEDSTKCKGSASGPDAHDSSKPNPLASAETNASASSEASPNATSASERSPLPSSSCAPPDCSTAPAAPEAASASAEGLRTLEKWKARNASGQCAWCGLGTMFRLEWQMTRLTSIESPILFCSARCRHEALEAFAIHYGLPEVTQ